MPPTPRSPHHQNVDVFDNDTVKARYQAYARLQSTAVQFGESLPIPEIVAVGGQSDGKSSLLEALLGVCIVSFCLCVPTHIQTSLDSTHPQFTVSFQRDFF